MSSYSYSQDCPECQCVDSLMITSNNRPYPSDSGECVECGFTYWAVRGFMCLEELNELREMHDMEELSELPKTEGRV